MGEPLAQGATTDRMLLRSQRQRVGAGADLPARIFADTVPFLVREMSVAEPRNRA